MIESQRKRDHLDRMSPFPVRRELRVRAPNEKGADRRWDYDRGRRFHPKCPQAADYHWSIHCVYPTAAGRFNGFVVTSNEFGPGEAIGFADHRGCEPVALQGYRNPEIEIFVFDNSIVIEHQAPESRMFLHCPND